MTLWPTDAELEDLVARFKRCVLSKADWTHQLHLAVGTWHVRTLGPDEALAALRYAIRALNDSHGTVNSDESGYHETITAAYVQIISRFISGLDAAATPGECARALLASPYARRGALLEHYSEGLLFSVAARRGWVDPDLAGF